jgi:hypothetical protein
MKTCIPVPPLQTHVARENTCHFLTPLSPFFPNSCSTAPPQLQWLSSMYQKENPHFSLRVPTSAYVGNFLFISSIPSRWLLTRTNNLPRSLGRQVIIKLFLIFLHKLTTRWSDEWWTHFSAPKQSNDLTYRVSSPQLPMLSPLLPFGSKLQETERAGCTPQQPSPIYWDCKEQSLHNFSPLRTLLSLLQFTMSTTRPFYHDHHGDWSSWYAAINQHPQFITHPLQVLSSPNDIYLYTSHPSDV